MTDLTVILMPDEQGRPMTKVQQQRQSLRAAAKKAAVRKVAEREKRRKCIVVAYQQGLTLQEVGDMFGVTRERIRQIVREEGVLRPSYDVVRQRSVEAAAEIDARTDEIMAVYNSDPNVGRVAEALGLSANQVSRVVNANVTEARKRAGRHSPKIPDSEIVGYLKRAKKLLKGKRLSTQSYERLRAQNEGWPSSQTIIKRWGTWNEAVSFVGEEAYGRPEGFGSQSISDEEILSAIRKVAEVIGGTPTTMQYNEHAKELGLPNLGTVRNRYKSWVVALEMAMGAS